MRVTGAAHLHLPLMMMIAALVAVLALAWRRGTLDRQGGLALLACYPAFIVAVLLVR